MIVALFVRLQIRNIILKTILNVINLISCTNCNKQYVGSAIDFKKRFRIHKSDINTKKDRCGVARHFNNKCQHPQNPSAFLKIQPIEQICVEDESKLDETPWHREKYWQALLNWNANSCIISLSQ